MPDAYVLERAGSDRRYVGAARSQKVRKEQHARGEGSAWLGGGEVRTVRSVQANSWEAALLEEAVEVAREWAEHGVEKVRGGPLPGKR